MNAQAIKLKKLHPRAQMPRYATDGAGCFDLYGVSAAEIPPMFAATVSTGLAFEIPEGHVMLVFSRSGHGFKHGIRLANCAGVIDADYRGPVAVRLHNDGGAPFVIEEGERIAQAIVIEARRLPFEWAESLSDTERGEGGFGSTGRI